MFAWGMLDQLYAVYCPSKSKNSLAQAGMDDEFLMRLGIDTKEIDEDTDLFFEVTLDF